MRKLYCLMAVGTVYVLASGSALAAEPDAICESSKLITSAKYAQCRLKAESKAVKKGVAVDYSKCTLDKFTKAQDKAGPTVCPTEDDQTTVSDYLDDCTSRAALWLAGDGGLPDTCESDLAACEAALGLPKTGQTTTYGGGSDGDLERGVARSFTDNGDGTITDNTTGLMWEKKADDGSIHDWDNTYTWSTGTNNLDGTVVYFMNSLNSGGGFAGYTDWRIPNIYELQSLVNFQIATNALVFPEFTGCVSGCTVTTGSCTKPSGYWSSSTRQNNPLTAYYVDFGLGNTGDGFKTGPFRVRAVRGGS